MWDRRNADAGNRWADDDGMKEGGYIPRRMAWGEASWTTFGRKYTHLTGRRCSCVRLNVLADGGRRKDGECPAKDRRITLFRADWRGDLASKTA
jgi:hypothetical protein